MRPTTGVKDYLRRQTLFSRARRRPLKKLGEALDRPEVDSLCRKKIPGLGQRSDERCILQLGPTIEIESTKQITVYELVKVHQLFCIGSVNLTKVDEKLLELIALDAKNVPGAHEITRSHQGTMEII